MSESYQELVRTAVLDADQFVEAAFRGAQRGAALPWREVTLRPVSIQGERHMQFSYFDARQHTAHNYRGDAAARALDELLAQPFRSIVVQTRRETLHVQFGKKGRPIVHRQPRAGEERSPELQHDRPKARLLPIDRPDPFLQAIGVQTADGRVRAGMQSKLAQIEQFLRALEETGLPETWGDRPLHIADLGCGSAHLTFAAYHFLRQAHGLDARLVGVDLKAELLARRGETAAALGWREVAFVASRIIDYRPTTPPDLVIALHACDTATDEAIAQGIRWGSRAILCAPCCHHHLQAQLQAVEPPPALRPIWRQGILREELGTVLTDAWRALLLRRAGYRAEVIEFVAAEHTPKNNLIRAVAVADAPDPRYTAEHAALKAFWQVAPYLETLL